MNNKNIKLVIIILTILVLLTSCQEKSDADSFNSIYIKKDPDCNKEAELYYTDSNNIKYYSVCLNEMTLKFDNKEISLKEALENDSAIMNQIINKLTKVDVAMDGGTTIYKDFGYSNVVYSEFGNTGFTIIKCNAMQDSNLDQSSKNFNQDYYLGDLTLEYEENYCKN